MSVFRDQHNQHLRSVLDLGFIEDLKWRWLLMGFVEFKVRKASDQWNVEAQAPLLRFVLDDDTQVEVWNMSQHDH